MVKDLIMVYNDLTNKVWKRMVDMVGVHTVIVLVKRTIWLTSEQYKEASKIKLNQEGILFNQLIEETGPDKSKQIIEEFYGNLLEILVKLIGKRIAQDIQEEINQELKGR